jgi:hypothetical protein
MHIRGLSSSQICMLLLAGNLTLANSSALQLDGLQSGLTVSGCAKLSGTLIVNLSPDDVESIKINGTTVGLTVVQSTQNCLEGQFDSVVVQQPTGLGSSTACEGALDYSSTYTTSSLTLLFTPPPSCNLNLNEDTPVSTVWWVALIVAGFIVVAVVATIVLFVAFPGFRKALRPSSRSIRERRRNSSLDRQRRSKEVQRSNDPDVLPSSDAPTPRMSLSAPLPAVQPTVLAPEHVSSGPLTADAVEATV